MAGSAQDTLGSVSLRRAREQVMLRGQASCPPKSQAIRALRGSPCADPPLAADAAGGVHTWQLSLLAFERAAWCLEKEPAKQNRSVHVLERTEPHSTKIHSSIVVLDKLIYATMLGNRRLTEIHSVSSSTGFDSGDVLTGWLPSKSSYFPLSALGPGLLPRHLD